MQNHHWQFVPIGLVATSAAVTFLVTVMAGAELGAARYGLWAAGLLALASVFWLRRPVVADSTPQSAQHELLAQQQAEVKEERRDFLKLQKKVEAELKRQSARIDSRSRRLADKLIANYEWSEYPQAIDLSDEQAYETDRARLAEQDRQVVELLERESQRLYDNVRQNKYAENGTFRVDLLSDDAFALMTQVARIYRPNVENPLLDTSIEHLARAASRACFHLLIVMENLPINLKQYNLNSLYGYLRQAIRGYGAYKTAEPYLGYLNRGFYLGRYLMGGNPLSLGAFWLANELGKRGAKSLVSRLVNRQAAEMLHDVVRVLGYEVASIYGGDFRHRDANWIYGVELTDLMSRFPISRENLAHALKEIGALQLRNEYDRIYLYRCLAEHHSADLRLAPTQHLSREERRQIVDRLEHFFEGFIHGKKPDRVELWQAHVEERYRIRPKVGTRQEQPSRQSQTTDAIRSLAGFLIAGKQKKVEELTDLLTGTRLVGGLEGEQRKRLFRELQENPPFEFAPPDIDPAGDLFTDFLEDLAALTVRTWPFDPNVDEMLLEFTTYFVKDAKMMQSRLDQQAVDFVTQRLQPDSPVKRLSPQVARGILQILEPNETPCFVYSDVSLQWPEASQAPKHVLGKLWFLGTDSRLVLFAVEGAPTVLWTAEADAQARRVRGYVIDDCHISGGTWQQEPATASPVLCLTGAMTSSYEGYFQPLLAHCANEPGHASLGLP